MEKTTSLNHIRIYPDGSVEGHFDLTTTHEREILKKARHIGVLYPGVSMADYLAGVNKSLVNDLNMPALDEKTVAQIQRVVGLNEK